jgi:hypothetical protein
MVPVSRTRDRTWSTPSLGRLAAGDLTYEVLLRWWRILRAVDKTWDRATRAEARDFAFGYNSRSNRFVSIGGTGSGQKKHRLRETSPQVMSRKDSY